MVERRNTGIKIWQHRSISGSLCECPFLPMYLSMHFTLGWSPIISVTFFDVFLFGVFWFCYLTVMLDGFYAFFILCNNTILSMAFLHFSIYWWFQLCQINFACFRFSLSNFDMLHAPWAKHTNLTGHRKREIEKERGKREREKYCFNHTYSNLIPTVEQPVIKLSSFVKAFWRYFRIVHW